MSDTSKITADHLRRCAFVYVRQSSAAQVEHNESCPFHKCHPALSKQRRRSVHRARLVSGSEGPQAEAGLLYTDVRATGEGH